MSGRIQQTIISLLSLAFLAGTTFAQSPAQDTQANTIKKTDYGSGIGMNISMTNSGFALGGYYARAISDSRSLIGEFSMTAGKHEKELRFFDYWGQSSIQGKYDYLLKIPVWVGIQQRLFKDDIQDNFRPFVQLSAGPELGWVYPYFDDMNGNDIRDQNERSFDSIGGIRRGSPIFGFSGLVAIGANFGISRKMTQGLRFGYQFSYFPTGVQLLEPRLGEDGFRKWFATPTISLVFGRLR